MKKYLITYVDNSLCKISENISQQIVCIEELAPTSDVEKLAIWLRERDFNQGSITGGVNYNAEHLIAAGLDVNKLEGL